MKNAHSQPLIALTCIFVMFVFGLFCFRKQNRTPVQVQKIPAAALADSAVQIRTDDMDIVNINTATSDQLQALPGIGPVLADRIVSYRRKHGAFGSIGELMHVEGIGEATLETIWDLVTTGG